MKLMVQYLAVAGGGAIGSVLRLFVAQVSGRLFGTTFPVGTLLINLSGSLFLGWFLTAIGGRVGERVLPASVVPLTSIPTFIRHGGARRARVQYGVGIPPTKSPPAPPAN